MNRREEDECGFVVSRVEHSSGSEREGCCDPVRDEPILQRGLLEQHHVLHCALYKAFSPIDEGEQHSDHESGFQLYPFLLSLIHSGGSSGGDSVYPRPCYAVHGSPETGAISEPHLYQRNRVSFVPELV